MQPQVCNFKNAREESEPRPALTARQLRHLAIRRNNWLVFASQGDDDFARRHYSLILSCKQCGANPDVYIEDVLMKVATTPASEIVDGQLKRDPYDRPAGPGLVPGGRIPDASWHLDGMEFLRALGHQLRGPGPTQSSDQG